jgi:hypothetical protein
MEPSKGQLGTEPRCKNCHMPFGEHSTNGYLCPVVRWTFADTGCPPPFTTFEPLPADPVEPPIVPGSNDFGFDAKANDLLDSLSFKGDLPVASAPPESQPRCPKCGELLLAIVYPKGSPLNRDQWESQLPGDLYCVCHNNHKGDKPYAYFWRSEFTAHTSRVPAQPPADAIGAQDYKQMVREIKANRGAEQPGSVQPPCSKCSHHFPNDCDQCDCVGEHPGRGDTPQVVWFHGTSPENADLISKEGFSEGTWFSKHMEDAIAFGGPCVFWVKVEFPKERAYEWQACSANAIPASAIQRQFRLALAGASPSPEPPSIEPDPAIYPLLKFQIAEDNDVDYSLDILIRQFDTNTGNWYYEMLATEPCKSRRDAQKTKARMRTMFDVSQNRGSSSEPPPSCTVCGTGMILKCPKCGSTPELTDASPEPPSDHITVSYLRLKAVLQSALDWNEEYKAINHLSGDPHWVSRAKTLGFIGKYEKVHEPSPEPPSADGIFWRDGDRWLREHGKEYKLLEIAPRSERRWIAEHLGLSPEGAQQCSSCGEIIKSDEEYQVYFGNKGVRLTCHSQRCPKYLREEESCTQDIKTGDGASVAAAVTGEPFYGRSSPEGAQPTPPDKGKSMGKWRITLEWIRGNWVVLISKGRGPIRGCTTADNLQLAMSMAAELFEGCQEKRK